MNNLMITCIIFPLLLLIAATIITTIGYILGWMLSKYELRKMGKDEYQRYIQELREEWSREDADFLNSLKRP